MFRIPKIIEAFLRQKLSSNHATGSLWHIMSENVCVVSAESVTGKDSDCVPVWIEDRGEKRKRAKEVERYLERHRAHWLDVWEDEMEGPSFSPMRSLGSGYRWAQRR